MMCIGLKFKEPSTEEFYFVLSILLKSKLLSEARHFVKRHISRYNYFSLTTILT